MGQQSSNALNAATRSGNGFAVSLETVTRVVTTQAIVRALSGIRSAVEDSYQSFTKFNQAAAEIQTILDQPLSQIRQDVRALSDEFNAPILDIAEAKYQALSNGFVTASDSSQVLTAALKFGKVGIASATDSVDLISTSLNAYARTADHAETISAKLFKTVELGRVVGTELANSFGRVAPVAHELGVSEDEVLAAFSSITIGGVKASEAATQIRSSLTALLKPSDAAKDALRALGVESGEELVAAKGYQGALKALIGTTDGSATATSELFHNIRALSGVLRETGTGADIYQQHLKAISEASASLLNQKYQLRIESNAEQVATQMNQLGNAIKVEVGEQLVSAAGLALKLAGGVDTISAAGSALLPIMAAGTASLILYGGACAVASVKASLLKSANEETSASFKILGRSLAAVTLAFSAYEIGAAAGKRIEDYLTSGRKDAEAASKILIAGKENEAAAAASIAHHTADAQYQDENSAAAKVRALWNQQTDVAKEQNEKLIADDKSAMDKIVSQHEASAAASKAAFERANDDIANSRERVGSLKDQLSDRKFDASNRALSPLAQSSKDDQRAIDLAKQGATALRRGDLEAANSAFQRAESYAQAAESAAAASKSTVAQSNAENVIQGILSTRIRAEAQYQATKKTSAAAAKKDGQAELARVKKLKSLQSDVSKNSQLFGDDGKPVGGKALEQHVAAAKASKSEFEKIAGVKLAPSKNNLDSLAKVIQGDLATRKFAIKLIPDTSKLDTGNKHLGELLKEGGLQRTNRHDTGSNAINAKQKTTNENNQVGEHKRLALGILSEKPTWLESFVNAAKQSMSVTTYATADKQQAQLNAYQSQLAAIAKSPGVPDAKQLATINSGLQTLSPQLAGQLVLQMQRLQEADVQLAQAITAAKPAAAAAPQPAAEAHSTGGLIKGYSTGGLAYLAAGGFPGGPKGTDTVPAWLSPNEYVVRAGPAQRFFSQLQAMNAGRAPEYRADGGDTHYHNYDVGGIHVHETKNPKATAREVLNAQKRQQRLS
ncbi:MAG TPA: phage tail tape measure protein [Pirellulales bacterium]|nr:phage tail tape measure protein [Pirellulales bacterium]